MFPCYRWAAFRQAVEEIGKNVKALTEDDGSVKYFQHIGGAHYISVTSGYKCVDFRKWFLPYDGKDDQMKPTKRGVALRLDEWHNLWALVDVINTAYPSLADAQPCYYQDDHMSQIGWLECLECHPFLNHPTAGSST